MAYRAIELAGGTYQHLDLSLTSQRTINFQPQRQQARNEKSSYTLESFYGLKPSVIGAGANRGIFEYQGVLYQLSATTLYSISSGGVRTSVGTIPGESRAVFAGLGTSIIVAVDGVAYTWDGSTFTVGTDVDFETPQTVTVMNLQALYDGDESRFGVSDVALPLTINALNYATGESNGDNLLRPYAFGTTVYMLGSSSIEQWWNSGDGNPPFDRIEGGLIEIGLGALHGVANDDNGIYLFGDDDQVYYIQGSVATPILPKVLVREINGFSTKSDAVAWTMQLDGQWFFVLKFKTGDKTYIYPKGGEWFELSSGVNEGRYNGDSYAFAYGKHYIANESGDILELDIDTYTDNLDPIRRVRTLAPVHAGLFGQPGRELEISSLRLVGKTGTGTLSGQGEDPEIILQYSEDGENFGTEIVGHVGKMGVLTTVEFDIGESFESWTFRLVSSDPVYSSWHTAAIEVDIGI